MSTEYQHIPVLSAEVLHFLAPEGPMKLIDATLGNGGHAGMLLEADPELELLGIDRDGDALERAGRNLAPFSERLRLRRGEFANLRAIAEEEGFSGADRILMDIGVSSPQLDDPDRGFSWRESGPLDMRMDRTQKLTASRILNFSTLAELTRIFREYGELPRAGKLAAAVVERREKRLFGTTADLVDLADSVLGKARPGRLPSPTLVFQALRIAVNDELGQLRTALADAGKLLKVGGRLAVISFHSLEDRIVKHAFREWARGCLCPPTFPVCVCGHEPEFRIITPKAITASEEEITNNRRSACAKLRLVKKIQDQP